MKFLLFVCIAAAISLSCAKIPYNEIDFNIFDSRTRDFEFHVISSTQIVKSFFARDDVSLAISAGMIAMKFAPYVNEFAKLIPSLRRTLEDQSEWRSAFTKAVSEETMYAITESEIRWMESSIQTIQTKIKLLGDENSDEENRKTIASIIHTDLDKMINFFDLKSSLFRKYPLLGTPPLIQLASVVAVFAPLAKSLIPMEAMNPEISCKMRDVLHDYRPRVVTARLRELRTRVSSFKSRSKIISMPHNPNGYNQTNPGIVDCNIGCKPKQMIPVDFCLEDRFSKNAYDISVVNGSSVCVENYAGLVRYRVEDVFPIALLDNLCTDQKPKKPTGFGWFTLDVQNVYLYGEFYGRINNYGWNVKCKPFIKLIVNNELMFETSRLVSGFSFDANIRFTTAKIRKNSTIKIQVWDAKGGFLDYDTQIFSKNGTVDTFLNEQIFQGDSFNEVDNSIEIVSFWRDEYE